MTTDLHKRIKEAAKKYADENYKVDYGAGTTPYMVGLDEGEHDGAEEGFFAGAEYGYKEAIKVAKKWLLERLDTEVKTEDFDAEHNIVNIGCKSRYNFLADFEADMNKLWEENQ